MILFSESFWYADLHLLIKDVKAWTGGHLRTTRITRHIFFTAVRVSNPLIVMILAHFFWGKDIRLYCGRKIKFYLSGNIKVPKHKIKLSLYRD